MTTIRRCGRAGVNHSVTDYGWCEDCNRWADSARNINPERAIAPVPKGWTPASDIHAPNKPTPPGGAESETPLADCKGPVSGSSKG